MRVLLDTHALIWATLSRETLSRKASKIIANPQNIIFVSAASAWEIATKVRIGKLPEAEILEQQFFEVIEVAGYTLLDINARCALRAGRLLGDHGDPFDRMIAAQSLIQDIPVISSDTKLDSFAIQRIW